MKTYLTAGLAGLTLSLGLAAAAVAQAPMSVETTPIQDLMANPASKAIVDKHLPPLGTHEAYETFKGMSLKQLQPLSQGAITDEVLTAIQADLNAL